MGRASMGRDDLFPESEVDDICRLPELIRRE